MTPPPLALVAADQRRAAPIDDLAARHLALALRRYRDELAERGYRRPAGLVEIEEMVEEAVKRGQNRSDADAELRSAAEPVIVADHSDRALSQAEAARRIGISSRTVRRWIDQGHLPCIGPARRVPLAAVEARRREIEEKRRGQ